MPLGAITDIEHARGLAPRNTARGAWVAFGSLGEGGVVSHAGAPRNFQTAPEGYSEGRQPGAARKADPAQRALTAALGCAPDGAGITSAEGSEARRISFRRHQPGPSRDGGEAVSGQESNHERQHSWIWVRRAVERGGLRLVAEDARGAAGPESRSFGALGPDEDQG